MQALTAPPRDGLTADQVTYLLVRGPLDVRYGVELLDASLNVLEDLSDDVSACTVSRDMTDTAVVHGSITMTISRELSWGSDRVRPYVRLVDEAQGLDARFNLGVYIVSFPQATYGETPASWTVTGQDQLTLLNVPVGDAYHVTSGTLILTAVVAALLAAGVTAPIQLDSTAAASTCPSPGMSWPLIPSSTVQPGEQTGSGSFRWIDVVNGLLAAVGYEKIWCDWDGNFRARPNLPFEQRPVEWTLDLTDTTQGVVEAKRTVTTNADNQPNRFVFYMNGLTGAPVEGTSLYVFNNLNQGPSSQLALNGRLVNAAPQGLDAADYASLVTQGNAITAAAIRNTETITTTLAPFPIAWHEDVVDYVDPELGLRRLVGQSWSLPLDQPANGMSYVWGTIQ